MTREHEEVAAAARLLAAAIGRRDRAAIQTMLAPGFVHRALGGARSDAAAFLEAIERIPGEIVFVRLEKIDVDLSPTGVLVTGVQHAQVLLDGKVVDDRRAFVDWLVKSDDGWRIQAAVELPGRLAPEG